MIPAGLFVESPHMEDVSLTPLDQNEESWPEEVVQKFKERIPNASSKTMIVKFMKKDEENGCATGSLLVSDSKKQAIIPIIIKDFMLYPLDVMIIESKLLPLTADYFKSCFDDNASFQCLEEFPVYGGLGRFEDSNLWNVTYPPSMGKYTNASGGYKILDEISSTVDGASLKLFLQDNPAVAANFVKNGQAEIIKKVANLRPVNMNEFRQGAENLIKKDILMLRKDGPNKYSILSNSSSVYNPIIKKVDKNMCMDFMAKVCDNVEDTMNEVDQNGEKMLMLPTAESDIMLGNPHNPSAEIAQEFDNYVVRKRNGVEVEGVVIPKVINFDQEEVPLKVFIGKGMATIQDKICGVRLQNSNFKIKYDDMTPGMTGTLVYQPDASHALCTIPFTIVSVVDRMGEIHAKVQDLQGKTYKLKMSQERTFKRIASMGENEYVIPDGMKFVAMEGFDEITNSPVDFAAKLASAKSGNPITIRSTGYGRLDMRGADKYASACEWDQSYLEPYQVKFILSSLGVGQDKIAEAIKTANRSGKCDLHHVRRPPTKSEKIAAAVPTATKMFKIANDLKTNLIKEASFIKMSNPIQGAQTVDTLLSLNFINPENVAKFVGNIPSLKGTISRLASLLIASRLGIEEIPEQAVSTSIGRLIDVINGLETLRSTQEMNIKAK